MSSRAVYSYDLDVRNKGLEHYILSSVDNLKTKHMLNIEYFKLKHGAKVCCQTGNALNWNANARLYDSACTKTMGKGSIINEIVQTCD